MIVISTRTFVFGAVFVSGTKSPVGVPQTLPTARSESGVACTTAVSVLLTRFGSRVAARNPATLVSVSEDGEAATVPVTVSVAAPPEGIVPPEQVGVAPGAAAVQVKPGGPATAVGVKSAGIASKIGHAGGGARPGVGHGDRVGQAVPARRASVSWSTAS